MSISQAGISLRKPRGDTATQLSISPQAAGERRPVGAPQAPPQLSREKEAAEVSTASSLGCCDLHKCINLHTMFRQP